MDKFKIILGAWQILAVFSSVTAVEFPASYSLFLSWINVLNFDLVYILSASCVLPSVNFYQQLLATTIAPFPPFSTAAMFPHPALILTWPPLVLMRWGNGRSVESTAINPLPSCSMQVFTSTSSVVLKTFACDNDVMEGERYLRADYSISCNTHKHGHFRKYAGLMVLV
ncbi:unnamed protein product, partial [Laminaria digitata]